MILLRLLLPGIAEANWSESKFCLGRVFNFKYGCFRYECDYKACAIRPTSRVENSAQVSSCLLQFVYPVSKKLTGVNQKAVLGRIFNFRVGRFTRMHILLVVHERQHLELKTRFYSIQQSDVSLNDIQHNENQYNDPQHNGNQ